MGISWVAAPPLFSLAKQGECLNDLLCLGRPTNFLSETQLRRLVAGFGLDWSEADIADISSATYCEPLLRKLGFKSIRSLDVSGYEDAEIIHDLNDPIPPELEASADCIFAGGTIEHVFNAAQALDNVVRLLRVGGTAVLASPMNGYIGHGFYQYSPELFYRFFEANGFEDIRCYLVGRGYPQRWFHVIDPAVAGQRIEFLTDERTEIVVLARKARALAKMVVPQQSDYASDGWMAEPETMAVRNDSWRTQDASAISKLITRASRSGAVAMRLLFGVGMPGVTNGRFFQKVDPFTRRF